MAFNSKILIICFLSLSCNKQYDLEACNDLSMKRFKGFTDARKKFEDNCTQFEIKYTHELCQSAFNELIFKNDLAAIKRKYGEPIVGCFTDQDLKKFTHSK